MKSLAIRVFATLLAIALTATVWSQTPAPYVIEFTSATYEGAEVGGTVAVFLKSTPPFRISDTNGIQVRIQSTDITARRGDDYELPAEGQPLALGAINRWSDGRWSFNIPLVDDGVHEPDETFEVTLSALSPNAIPGARSTATVTIHNSAPTFSVQLSPTLLPDGSYNLVSEDSGSRPLLEVIRRGDRDVAAGIDLNLVGTDDPYGNGESLGLKAVPGVDFQAFNQRIDFASGEIMRSIVVSILDDDDVEQVGETRYFEARLSNPSAGAEFWAYGPVVGIVNNELPATLDVTRDPAEVSPLIFFGQCCQEPGVRFAVSSEGVSFLPLPGGKKLAVGRFIEVNGVPRPGLARLDANDELDEGFRPPEGLMPLVDNPFLLIPQLLALRSGALLVPDGNRRFVRLNDDGSLDTSFPSGLSHVAEAADGSLWGVRSNEVVHLALDGSMLSYREIPARTTNQTLFAIQSDGRLLIHDQTVDANNPGEELIGLIRCLPDGSTDPSFNAIRPFWRGAILPDGRMARFTFLTLQVFTADGGMDPTFPPVHFSKYGDGRPIYSVTLRGGQLRVFSPILEAINGAAARAGAYGFFLTNAPKTALQLTGQAWYDPETGWYRPFERLEPVANHDAAFNVTFRRLGNSAGPASATFITRNLTAIAGKDYVAQSGKITFAPLEVEKTLSIPILENPENEMGGQLEVVVTSGEGFEALPVPLRLTIIDSSGATPPPPARLHRIKRLNDGRVILEGSSVLVSDTTLESSADLKTWSPIPNLQGGWTGGFGPAMWLDPSATNSGARFYRTVIR